MELKVKLTDGAPLLKHAKEGDAGMDLTNVGPTFHIDPHETVMVHTGVWAEIPEGYNGEVRPRSGIASKRNLAPINAPGTVDSHYRGEILVPLHNFGERGQDVEHGERIAQMVVAPFARCECVEVEELSETDRGSGGFGSTGRM